MFLILVKREIAGHVLSFRFIVTFVLFFSLILVSVLVLTNGYAARQQSYEASRSAHQDALAQVAQIKDPQQQLNELLLNKGVYSDLRPQQLSLFVDGIEPRLPSQVHAALFNVRRVDEEAYRNPVLALFASPDYGYIVNIVVSLLALLFVFDAICGEKERGTLKLVLANPVPRDQIILAKWVGGYLSLAAPFLVAVLAGAAYVRLSGAVALDGRALQRLAGIVAVSLLYISVYFTLGLAISTLTHRGATALVVSLFAWICWTLVIPNLAPVAARIARPVPSVEKIAAEKLAVDQETELRARRVSQSMLSYGQEGQRVLEEIQAEGERTKDKLDRFYEDQFQAQIDLSRTLSRISPAASFRYATTEMAQTGIGLFDGYRKAYKRFQQDFSEYGDRLNRKQNNRQLEAGWFQSDQLPIMKVPQAQWGDTLDRIGADLLLLGIFNLLLFMGAYAAFLRYDAT
jgi:ABC-type transport system involved in multi-copper enzyme maturation permease subunit